MSDNRLNNSHDSQMVFTDEEIEALRQTKALLVEKGVVISPRELILATMNCKLRPETAANKYCLWMDSIKQYGYESFEDVWKNIDWEKLEPFYKSYAGCGTDNFHRAIMWIRGGQHPVQIPEEPLAIQAGCIYFTAIHADAISIRNGITFIIDTADDDMLHKVGNESKLQKTYQSMPLRPQQIFILGANILKRAIINGLITIASFFTKEKVLERIKFAVIDDVKEVVSDDSMPVYHGGKGGGIENNNQLVDWIRRRLDMFPALPAELM